MDEVKNSRYSLSREEFVSILTALKDIPRIYGQMTKIEQHIERLSIRQDQKIEEMGKDIDRLKYQFEDMSKRVDESPYVESRKNKKSLDEGLSKDLINIIVKGLTVLGTFGTIMYALLQTIGK